MRERTRGGTLIANTFSREGASLHRSMKITAGRGNDPYINLCSAATVDPFELSLLQHT